MFVLIQLRNGWTDLDEILYERRRLFIRVPRENRNVNSIPHFLIACSFYLTDELPTLRAFCYAGKKT